MTSLRPIGRRQLVVGGLSTAASAATVAGWQRRHQPSSPAAGQATPAATPPPPGTTPAATPSAGAIGGPLEYATVAQLRGALDRQRLSTVELVDHCLARIGALDDGENGLGAAIELNPDARDIAHTLDQELRAGRRRGPLHGIPILVKDVFATADQMATTAGSYALLANRPVRDAFVIDRLRQAGAIVLGKANLTEWCNFKGSVQTSGWSSRGGQTRNPYRLSHTAWGSSSGSAVAVSAGYVPLALGVETDGSIVCPASATAVVGLKPTVGLTSRSGVISLSFTQDSPGPLARSVEDVAYLLTAIAGADPTDYSAGPDGWSAPGASSATPVPAPATIDYTRFLDPNGLNGARIGVARNLFFDADASATVESVLPMLSAAGATLLDPANMPSLDVLSTGELEYTILITEFPYVLETYLRTLTPDGPMATLADIVAYNEAHPDQALAVFDQATFYSALDSGSVTDGWYRTTLDEGLPLAREYGIDALLDENELDAVIAPTVAAPTPISPTGDSFPGSSSQISAIAGYPILNVPAGFVGDLPVGISFIGRAFSEPTLLKLGYAFERLNPARRPPEFRLGTLP